MPFKKSFVLFLFFDKFSEILQGCDGSVLLEGSTSEQNARPNLSLRKEALKFVDDLRARVHKECGRVVSCADILALAARDSVALVFIFISSFTLFAFLVSNQDFN